MRRRKRYVGLILILVMAIIFTACAKGKYAKENSGSSKSDQGTDMVAPEYNGAEEPADDYVENEEGGLTNTSIISSEIPDPGIQEKIIKNVAMNVETQKFDDLISAIDQQIKSLGGYVESSKISGQRFYSEDDSRYGDIIARIPKDRLDEFVNTIYKSSNVVHKEESSRNVTLEYINADSHKKTLEIEQERLLAILGKAESLEDILVLESRLSDIRYELQKYETQLRTYDNLVEYSTVTLNIKEVERIVPVSEGKKTVWERISTGFGNTMYHISEGLQNFMVWFVVNLPYLIIWGGIITGIVLIARRYFRKKYPKNYVANKTSQDDKKQ